MYEQVLLKIACCNNSVFLIAGATGLLTYVLLYYMLS
jgi:hypothetical protein